MTDEELYQELIDEWDSLSEEINSSWDKLQAEVPYDIFNEIKEWVNYECNQFGTSYEGLVDKTQVTGDAQLSEFSFCKYEYVDQYCGITSLATKGIGFIAMDSKHPWEQEYRH